MGKKPAPKRETIAQIKELFEEAATLYSKDPASAHRAIAKARALAMRIQTPLPASLKRRYCHHCHHYLQPGVNNRTRIRDGKIVIYCMDCKHYTRIHTR